MDYESIKNELTDFAKEQIKDGIEADHLEIFNSDYYIIGYHEANEWLKKHGVNIFEGIDYCRNREIDEYGENSTDYKDSEILVNHIVYWIGMDISLESLKEHIETQEI